MPRSTSARNRGTKRQRTSTSNADTVHDKLTANLPASPTTPALPASHLDSAVNSLLQSSATADPPSPPHTSLSSHYFDAHIGSGKHGSKRGRPHQQSLLAVRQEAIQAGFDPSIPLLCKNATERSERLLAEHRQLFPKWHMQLKSATHCHPLHTSRVTLAITQRIDHVCSSRVILLSDTA